MDSYRYRNHFAIRKYQVSRAIDDITHGSMVDGFTILFIGIFTLLRVVGMCKLLQRWLLLAVESSTIFHGLLVICSFRYDGKWFDHFSTDNRIDFDRLCSAHGQYRAICNTKKDFMHRWNRFATHCCQWTRSIYFQRFTRRGFSTSGKVQLMTFDTTEVVNGNK